jgi:hypothetical protein
LKVLKKRTLDKRKSIEKRSCTVINKWGANRNPQVEAHYFPYHLELLSSPHVSSSTP